MLCRNLMLPRRICSSSRVLKSLTVAPANGRNQIPKDIPELYTLLTENIADQITGVKEDIAKNNKDIAKNNRDIARNYLDIKKNQSTLQDLSADMGRMWETQARVKVEHLYGESFSKSLKINTIEDISYHIAECMHLSNKPAIAYSQELIKMNVRISEYLTQNNTLPRYCKSLFDEWLNENDGQNALKLFEPYKAQMFGPDGDKPSLQLKMLKDFIGKCYQNTNYGKWKSFVIKLEYLLKNSANMQTDPAFIYSGQSCAVNLLLFDALVKHVEMSKSKLNKNGGSDKSDLGKNGDSSKIELDVKTVLSKTPHELLLFLPSSVDIDVKGKICIVDDSKCDITVGEIKKKPKYIGKATKQLFLRAIFFKNIVSILKPEIKQFYMSGHVFSIFENESKIPVAEYVNNVFIRYHDLRL